MGTEYRVRFDGLDASDLISPASVEQLPSFHAKRESRDGISIDLGWIGGGWPELSVWWLDGDLGITLHGSRGQAWDEVHHLIDVERTRGTKVTITDWDDGD